MKALPGRQYWSLPVCQALDRLRGSRWSYCIVCFHRIWDGSQDELSYPAGAFRALCRYWRDHYAVINLDTLLARLASREPAPEPTLTITFDDGYADNAEIAAPILDQFELSATFFVTTGALGIPSRFAWDQELGLAPAMMSWAQVRALRGAGFGVGSHTVHHVRMAGAGAAEQALELRASRQRLEKELGEPVLDFAYPFGGRGDCDAAVRAAVRVAGYRSCLSAHGGIVTAADSPFHLNRICVSPSYHATPQAWARHYTRLRWRPAQPGAASW
ncbi:MAG: polysaccharide deacetylase family protein [Terriglobales bacterium]